jgi:hypothetical protein
MFSLASTERGAPLTNQDVRLALIADRRWLLPTISDLRSAISGRLDSVVWKRERHPQVRSDGLGQPNGYQHDQGSEQLRV